MQLTAAQIAHVCHAANRALQIEQADPTIPVSEKWDKLDEETRQSAIDGVEAILSGKVKTPEDSHNNWMQFKLDHGWKFGPVKDEAKKEHPLLIPYSELPEAQRVKDDVYSGIVKALGSFKQTPEEAFAQGASEGRG